MSLVAPSVLDAWVHPDETAAGLAQWTPQAGVIPVLDELTPAVLSADGRIDALVAVERHIAMLHARSSELLAAIDAGDPTEDGWARDCVAAALRVPPASMKTRMSVARDLADRLPATLALLRAGGISQRHATDLVEATRSLPPEKAALVEAHVLARAPEQTAAQFRAAIRREVLRVTDPVDDEAAHQDALAERRVVFTPAPHGMTEQSSLLPADGAATLKAALDAMAHATIHQPGGDPRTADQRRADALVDLARNALAQYGPTGTTTSTPGGANRTPATRTPATRTPATRTRAARTRPAPTAATPIGPAPTPPPAEPTPTPTPAPQQPQPQPRSPAVGLSRWPRDTGNDPRSG